MEKVSEQSKRYVKERFTVIKSFLCWAQLVAIKTPLTAKVDWSVYLRFIDVWVKDFIHESCLKEEAADFRCWRDFKALLQHLELELELFHYLWMVIWRGIYLVGPLEPSTHLLHTPL